MCTNLSVISIHLNTVKNLLTLFWNSLDLGWEAGILFESCRHGKLESQLKNVNNLLFFMVLPLGFLAAQGQHDNCSSFGCTVAFFKLFPSAKGEGRLCKGKQEAVLLTCSSPLQVPASLPKTHPERPDQGCLHTHTQPKPPSPPVGVLAADDVSFKVDSPLV